MILVYIWAFIIALISLVVLSLKKPNSLNRLIAKTITSALFITILISGAIDTVSFNPVYFVLLLLAQVASLAGDVLLGANAAEVVKNKFPYAWRQYGCYAFMIAHVFFSAAMIYLFGFSWISLIVPVLGAVGAFYATKHFGLTDKKLVILLCVYAGLMTFMVSTTLGAAINTGFASQGVHVMLAGLFFLMSDSTLLFKYYAKKPLKFYSWFSCITYYVAQFLFALSVISYL